MHVLKLFNTTNLIDRRLFEVKKYLMESVYDIT